MALKKEMMKIRIIRILCANEQRDHAVARAKCNVVNQSDGGFIIWKYANNTDHFYSNFYKFFRDRHDIALPVVHRDTRARLSRPASTNDDNKQKKLSKR